MKVCKRPAAVAANPPTTVNPPPVNSPPVKLQQTNGPQVNVQGTLFGWSIVLSGNKVCKDPFVWLDAKEITC